MRATLGFIAIGLAGVAGAKQSDPYEPPSGWAAPAPPPGFQAPEPEPDEAPEPERRPADRSSSEGSSSGTSSGTSSFGDDRVQDSWGDPAPAKDPRSTAEGAGRDGEVTDEPGVEVDTETLSPEVLSSDPRIETQDTVDLTPSEDDAIASTLPEEELDESLLLDGHVREGAFLAGPGSLTFILHHTVMGAAGGFVTQGIGRGFNFDSEAREGMLLGTLIGAGFGFAASSWWQFTHWIDTPMANFGMVASAATAMFFTGMIDLTTDNPSTLAWTAFVGAEVGAWLAAGLAGGEMPASHAWTISSGAGWGVLYGALFSAILATSGSGMTLESAVDTMLMGAGIGLAATTLGLMQFEPTTAQVIRANVFGAGVGGAVLVASALLLGFDTPTPYVLSLLSSLGAITTVSLFWEEAAERPKGLTFGPAPAPAHGGLVFGERAPRPRAPSVGQRPFASSYW